MGRTPCCDKANVKKGPWSPEEDAKLKDFIEKNGTGGNWIALPQKAGLSRCGKSCRLRWLNYLRPNIKHGDFSEEEDRIICRLYDQIRTKWSVIAAHLPGRTDNDIKNYWNTKLKKKYLASAAQNNIDINIINPPPQFFPPPQIHQSQPNMPLFYRDFNYTPSSYMPIVSVSDIHQTLPINPLNYHQSFPQASTNQYFNNQIMPENRDFGLVFEGVDQALSSGSSGGSFMSQITQDQNMASHPQNYSSISSNTSNITWNNVYKNQENVTLELDYGLVAPGTITSPLYENVEEIKPVINNKNNLSYLGFENGNKKKEEREEMYY